jgi:acyl carrier protein
MMDELRRTVAAALGLAPEKVDDDFDCQASAAWDSLAHLRLVMALEEQFAVRFEDDELEQLTSVQAIARVIGGKKAQA